MSYEDPIRFRIDVEGSKRAFVFEAPNSDLLRKWTQALYANWNAARSAYIKNKPNMMDSKFWKVSSKYNLFP